MKERSVSALQNVIQLPPHKPGQAFEDWLLEALYKSYLDARQGKRKKPDQHEFEINLWENLKNLRDEIIARTYRPSPGIAFIVFKPVQREIFAAPFRDRIVHHLVFNLNAEWWDRHMIPDAYSCRKGKGTLYGVERAARHIRRCSHNYTKKCYVVKLDIRGYFMSLPHNKLYERILWGLKRQFMPDDPLYSLCKFLWRQIIFDNPTKGVKLRGYPANWQGLPDSKSLLKQKKGVGIVIGNLSSQLLSNIYLTILDRYITMELGYKYYGRYVDDFYFVVPAEQYEQALEDVKKIEKFLHDKLQLILHPEKRYFHDVRDGFPFLGAIIKPGRIVPGHRVIKNFSEAAYEVETGQRSVASVISYMGLMKHMASKITISRIFDANGWGYHF